MKNMLAVRILVVTTLLFVTFGLKADIPPPTIPIVDLPYTFSLENEIGLIDLDGDGIGDFEVEFYTLMGDNVCLLSAYRHKTLAGSGLTRISGNQILTEFADVFRTPLANKTVPLSTVVPDGPSFCRIMKYGELIGTEDLYDGDAYWYFGESAIMYTGDFSRLSPLQANSYEDGVHQGYLGVYFYGASGWYYGWINVEIDPAGHWVTLNSSGTGTDPEAPVAAGLHDPFAVPIPIIATLIGFGLIGGGIFLRKRKKK